MHCFRILITLFMILMIVAEVSAGITVPLKVEPVDSLHANFQRSYFQEWLVFVTDFTFFHQFDGPADPVEFTDLEVGHIVYVDGMLLDPLVLEAYFVEIFCGGSNWGDYTPDPMHGAVLGAVNEISYDDMWFTVLVNGYQGREIVMEVMPDAVIMEALPDQPLVDISFFDLNPDDPIMAHGYFVGDMFLTEVLIRSEDWIPFNENENDEVCEVYGWIADIWLGPGNEWLITLFVETMTGDPNHQMFEKYIGFEGGIFEFPWGHIIFPRGALSYGEVIRVSGDFMFWWTLHNIYEFAPHMEFNLPVEIEICYYNLDGIPHPDRVHLSYFDEESERWRPAAHMVCFPDEHCFRGSISHFSRYSLSTNSQPLQQVLQDQ